MARQGWTPKDYERLVISGTVSMCLLVLTLGITVGVLQGKINAELLGGSKGAAIGSGLLGLAAIFWRILVRTTK